MKVLTYLTLFVLAWASAQSMDEQIADELEQEFKEQKVVQKLGGKERCTIILAQWSNYEKRLLATLLHEFEKSSWPVHRKGEAIPFARGKEVYQDRFLVLIDNKKISVSLEDFKIVAQLHQVPVFASYSEQMLKFDNLRHHFENEDDIWEQCNRQLQRESK